MQQDADPETIHSRISTAATATPELEPVFGLLPDPATVHQQGQTISAATVHDDQIGFHVSSSQQAVVTIPTATEARRAIVLHSFRTGRDILDVDYGICRKHHSHDVVYLNCTESTGEFHLECMEDWLMHRSSQSNFTCPSWYEP